MARIDKITSSFRAIAGTALTGVLGVKLNAGGSVVPSGTPADAIGVVCPTGTIAAGKPVTVIQRGELTEFGGTIAGTFYAGASGSVSVTSTNAQKIGYTVEADRLVILL